MRLAAQENQRISGDEWKGRCPSTFNPQGQLCRPEERLWRFLYQFLAVKIGLPALFVLEAHFYKKLM